MNIAPSSAIPLNLSLVARTPAIGETVASVAANGLSNEPPTSSQTRSPTRVPASEAVGNDGEQTRSERSAEEPTLNGLTDVEQQEVRDLAARDREVRAHEQAHANVGGRYAGSPSYTYQRGPDGRQYAVGGEVSISTSPIPGDPEATIDKAQIVRRAALAPAEPSAQDRRVAAEATAIEQQARAELLAQRNEAAESSLEENRVSAANPSESSLPEFNYRPIDALA